LQRLYDVINGIANLAGDVMNARFPGFDKIQKKVREDSIKRMEIIRRRVKREARLRRLSGEEEEEERPKN
jgi:hypothetical protein